ncbi:hypothetical protein [Streptomyces sp. NPDC002676]
MRARNFGGSAVAAVIALAVTGCSSGSGDSKGSEDSGASSASSPSAVAKAIGAPGTVTVSWCDVKGGTSGAPNTQQLTLASYSVTDGQEVARRVSVLPPGADTGILCDSTPTGQTSVPSALRGAFNKDFTLVAGVMPALQQSAGSSDGPAVAFSLKPQSTPVGAPSADPVTAGAKDRTPVFQSGTSTLWYENGDRHVMSRDLGRRGAAATDRGVSHNWGFVLAGDQPWSRLPLGSDFKDVIVNPSGTAAAAGGSFGSGIWLKDAAAPSSGDEYVEPLRFGPNSSGTGDKALPGGGTVPQCTPKFWIDDHSLFCAGKGFSRVVLSNSLDSVQKVEQLLPDNDRDNRAVAPSPDLKSVVFLSRQGQDVAELYRLDLTPGAAPKKIGTITPNSPGVQSELRLVAWQ